MPQTFEHENVRAGKPLQTIGFGVFVGLFLGPSGEALTFLIAAEDWGIWGLAIGSAVFFLGMSGLLMATRLRHQAILEIGSVALSGALGIAIWSTLAPSFVLGVAACIVFTAAAVLISIDGLAASSVRQQGTKPLNSQGTWTKNSSLVSNSDFWSVLACIGVIGGLAVLVSSCYRSNNPLDLFLFPFGMLFLIHTLLFVPLAAKIGIFFLGSLFRGQRVQGRISWGWATILAGVIWLCLGVASAGEALSRSGAVMWSAVVTLLGVSVLSTSLLCSSYADGPIWGLSNQDGQGEETLSDSSPPWLLKFKQYGLFLAAVLILNVVTAIFGYGGHFMRGVNFTERVSSLGSVRYLEKILNPSLDTQAIAFSADGNFLIVSGKDLQDRKEMTQTWDLKTGTKVKTDDKALLQKQKYSDCVQSNLPFIAEEVMSCKFAASSDNKTVAIRFDQPSIRNTVFVWDKPSGQLLRSVTYLRRDHGSSAIALSPDGQWLATSDLANTASIAIWKISND